MSKAFIAQVLQDSADLTGTAANQAAGDLMDAVVKALKTASSRCRASAPSPCGRPRRARG
jgi:hypothetical protein